MRYEARGETVYDTSTDEVVHTFGHSGHATVCAQAMNEANARAHIGTGWRPLAAEDQTRPGLVGVWPYSVRFQLYSPNSDQYRRGMKGRWQRSNGYGGWDNCDPPVLVEERKQ